jgi:very-short-patch-repair endonuclease
MELGGTPDFICGQLKSGGLRKVMPGVYLIGGALLTTKARMMAATLWAGPGGVVSHASAAWLYGLIRAKPKIIEVTLRERRRPPTGIKVHVDPSLTAKPKVRFDGIPVPRIERVLFDLCGTLSPGRAERMVVQAIRDDRVEVVLLARALDLYGGNGKKGTRVLRRILSTRIAMGVTDSDAEDLFAAMADRRGLSLAHHHVVVDQQFRAELDFASIREQIDVEIDGGIAHFNPVKNDRDKARYVELGRRGWLVLRFTYWDLVTRPEWVFDSIATALRTRQGFHNPRPVGR